MIGIVKSDFLQIDSPNVALFRDIRIIWGIYFQKSPSITITTDSIEQQTRGTISNNQLQHLVIHKVGKVTVMDVHIAINQLCGGI